MLEKACMAVEEAAKGGGVYPEVLFEVAHQWFWLYEQTAGGSSTAREGATSCSASGIRAAGVAGRGLPLFHFEIFSLAPRKDLLDSS